MSAALLREWAERLRRRTDHACEGEPMPVYVNGERWRELVALLEASAECAEALRMAGERYRDVLRWLGPCEHDVGHCVCAEVYTAERAVAALAKLDAVGRALDEGREAGAAG